MGAGRGRDLGFLPLHPAPSGVCVLAPACQEAGRFRAEEASWESVQPSEAAVAGRAGQGQAREQPSVLGQQVPGFGDPRTSVVI